MEGVFRESTMGTDYNAANAILPVKYNVLLSTSFLALLN